MNPLLSEDDDSSLSNYQESTDSSLNLRKSQANSRVQLNSDNVVEQLNKLAVDESFQPRYKSSFSDRFAKSLVKDEQENTTIEDDTIAKSKLSKANSHALDTLSRSFYYEDEYPIKDQDPVINREEIIEKVIKPYEQSKPLKILVRFQSIGSTEQIEPRVYKISNSQQFSLLIKFLNKKLRLENTHSTYCYIHNSFSPSPDEIIGNLFKNFAVNNELVVSYCENVAFG